MKKILTIIAAAALALGASAQQDGYSNYAGIAAGGGLGTMQYNLQQGTHGSGLGFEGGLHYAHFFGEHWGAGIGVQYNFAQATALYNFTEVSEGIVHADNTYTTYDLHTDYRGWKERQRMGFVSIPVECLYRTPLNEAWLLIAGLGARVDFNIHGKYTKDEGDYVTTGYFPAIGHTVENLPLHGFSTYEADFESAIEKAPVQVSLIADLGARRDLGDGWGFYLGLYAGYGLTNMVKESSAPLLTLHPSNAMEIDYNGTFASNQTQSVHLLCAGVKIGVDLGWNCEPKARVDLEALAREQALRDSIEAARVADSIARAHEAELARIAAEKAEAEARAKAEADSIARAHEEELARQKAEAEAELAKIKDDAERAKAEAEAEAARLAQEKAEAEARAKAEAEERERAEAEALAKARAEQKAREQAAFLAGFHDVAYFETAKDMPIWAQLNEDSWDNLREIMEEYPDVMVTISGHTDNVGKPAYNQNLSERRAESIKAMLVAKGIPASRIKAEGRGMNQPIADNKTAEGRAKNRRVEIDIYRQK